MSKTPFDPAKLALGDTVGASDMTVGEMLTRYRQAKHKSWQIQTLADLSELKPDEIKALLVAHGVTLSEMPRTPRSTKKGAAHVPDASSEALEQTVKSVNAAIEALVGIWNRALQTKREVNQTIEQIQTALDAAREKCRDDQEGGTDE